MYLNHLLNVFKSNVFQLFNATIMSILYTRKIESNRLQAPINRDFVCVAPLYPCMEYGTRDIVLLDIY